MAQKELTPEELAQKELENENIKVRVIDIHTIKPLDEELIVKAAKETKKLITVEDHSVIGGLGSAVADLLAIKYPKKLTKLGINDEFGKSGKWNELMDYYKITAKYIVDEVKKN